MTRAEAQKIFRGTLKTMINAGFDIPYASIKCDLQFNNTTRSLGQCKRKRYGDGYDYSIYISRNILDGDKNVIRDTIAHEIIHTMDGCFNHKKLFKSNAQKANDLFGWNVTTRADQEECEKSGIAKAEKIRAKYLITCQGCGQTSYRQKKSKLIDHIERYRCGKCKGSLTVQTI